MQKVPVSLPTLPVATASKPPVLLSSIKLCQMKEAICIFLLDDALTGKDEVVTSRLTHLSCGIAAHGQVELDELYKEVKETNLSVTTARRKFYDSGLTYVTDPNDKRLLVVTVFLDDANNRRDADHAA
jgi:hypothetical protein